jgi:glutathionylspermidine synthase
MYRIEISNNRTLQEIQDEFNEYFPHLKIQFHQIDKFYPGSFSELFVESADEKLMSFRLKSNSGYLYLNEDSTVSKLKQNILDYYGLKAEFFQVTDLNLWSENPITDNQLLREINFEIT